MVNVEEIFFELTRAIRRRELSEGSTAGKTEASTKLKSSGGKASLIAKKCQLI